MFIGPKAQNARGASQIDDHSASFNYEKVLASFGEAKAGEKRWKLGELLEHPELFKSYPELRSVEVVTKRVHGDTEVPTGAWGSIGNERQRLIMEIPSSINGNTDPEHIMKNMAGVVLHEAQHIIQQIERWPRGSNQGLWHRPAKDSYRRSAEHASNLDDPLYVQASSYFFGDLKERKSISAKWPLSHEELLERTGKISKAIDSIAHSLYLRDPGEVQARVTQNRYLGKPEERIYLTENVRTLPHAPKDRQGYPEAVTRVKFAFARLTHRVQETENKRGNEVVSEDLKLDRAASQSDLPSRQARISTQDRDNLPDLSGPQKLRDIGKSPSKDAQLNKTNLLGQAFDKLSPKEALQHFPELEGSYKVLSQAKKLADLLPGTQSREVLFEKCRARISADLHAGNELVIAPREAGRER